MPKKATIQTQDHRGHTCGPVPLPTRAAVRWPRFLLLLAACLPLVSCGERQTAGPVGSEELVPTGAMLVEPGNAEGTVGLGLEHELVWQVLTDDGGPAAGATVEFRTEENGVVEPDTATVDAEGRVRTHWTLGPAAGEQTISVLALDRASSLGSWSVLARPGPPSEVRVLPAEITLGPGGSGALAAEVVDRHGNPLDSVAVAWRSVDPDIAEVEADGRVTAFTLGSTMAEAVLIADSASGTSAARTAEGGGAAPGKSAQARVNVLREGAGGGAVEIVSGSDQAGVVGETLSEKLVVSVVGADGAPLRNMPVHWEAVEGSGAPSDEVTRTNGQGRAEVSWSLGTATGTENLDARAGDVGTVRFAATAATGPVHEVTVTPSEAALSVGETLRFSAAAMDRHGNDVPVTEELEWSTADPSVASTKASGDVTAAGAGTTTVVASVGGMQGSAALTVAEQADPDPDEEPDDEDDGRDGSGDDEDGAGDEDAGQDSSGDDGEDEEDETVGGDDGEDTSSGGGSAAYPNEPSGFELIAQSSMSELFPWGPGEIDDGYGSWWQWEPRDGDTSLRTGSKVPGGPYFNRTRYPEGLSPGRAPVNWGAWNPGSTQAGDEYERIYFSQRIRLVDTGTGDWASQGVGTKLGFWAAGRCSGADNDVYAFLQGGTRSEFTIKMLQQNVTSRAMRQNRKDGAVMLVGRWHQWEIEMVLNDIGSENGVLRWWVDGDLVLEYTDVVYRTSRDSCGFRAYKWNPTWGGTGGGDRTRDDFVDISEIRISGKPMH